MTNLDDSLKAQLLSDADSERLREPVPFAYGLQEIPGTSLLCIVVTRANSSLMILGFMMLLAIGGGVMLLAMSRQPSSGLTTGQAIVMAVALFLFGLLTMVIGIVRTGRRRQVTIDPSRELVSRDDELMIHDRAAPGWIEVQLCELRPPKPSASGAAGWYLLFGGLWLLRGGKYPSMWVVYVCTDEFRERVAAFKRGAVAERYAEDLARRSGLSIRASEGHGIVIGERMLGFGASDTRVAARPKRAKPIVLTLQE